MRPDESKSQTRLRASSIEIFSSAAMAWQMRLAMPMPAEPAPKNRNVCSRSFMPVKGPLLITPASTTEAVPAQSPNQVSQVTSASQPSSLNQRTPSAREREEKRD